MTATDSTSPKRTVLRSTVSLGTVLGTLLFAVLLSNGVALALGAFTGVGEDVALVAGTYATQLGLLAGAAAFLAVGRGPGWIPVSRPSRRALRIGAVALGVAVAAETARQLAVRFTDLGVAGTLPVTEELSTAAWAALIAATVLVAPPIEELLFRGIVQRYVREVASAPVAVAVATVLFVPLHALGVLATAPGPLAALAVFAAVTVLSVSAGLALDYTDNLAVPVGVHAGYNALAAVVGFLVHGTAVLGPVPV